MEAAVGHTKHNIFQMAAQLTMMNLKSLASELQGFAGVTRKKQIGDLVRHFPSFSDQVIADFGEDAAVIGDGDEVLLFAADRDMAASSWMPIPSGLGTVQFWSTSTTSPPWGAGPWPWWMCSPLTPGHGRGGPEGHEDLYREVQGPHRWGPPSP